MSQDWEEKKTLVPTDPRLQACTSVVGYVKVTFPTLISEVKTTYAWNDL
jgi:hypothetical protein